MRASVRTTRTSPHTAPYLRVPPVIASQLVPFPLRSAPSVLMVPVCAKTYETEQWCLAVEIDTQA